MLSYDVTTETLAQFCQRKLDRSLESLEKETQITFLLIDEMQITYPQTEKQLNEAFGPLSSTKLLKHSLNQFCYFQRLFKALLQNQYLRIRCFSAYSERKPGSKSATPWTFDIKTSQYSRFTKMERGELYDNFIKRTRIQFIRKNGVTSKIRNHITSLTNNHVGYTACILHELNDRFNECTNELAIIACLNSPTLLNRLGGQRPLFNKDLLTNSRIAEALQSLWIKGTDDLSFRKEYTILLRSGWICYDNEERKTVGFSCPIVRQLILIAINDAIVIRPNDDNFKNLGEFIDTFLSRIKADFFRENVMNINVNGGIKEAKWQNEFYHAAASILGRNYDIGVEVTKGVVKDIDSDDESMMVETEFKLKNGRLDFYINGTRQWAVELLIRGELSRFDNLDEHVARFSTGQYKDMPRKDELVIDFRPLLSHSTNDIKSLEKPKKHYHPNTWIVFYDINGEKNDLIVVKYGKDGCKIEKKTFYLLGNMM